MHFKKKLLQTISFIVFITMGVIWAAFVVVRYLHVDNNFLVSIFLGYKQYLVRLLIAGVLLFILFALIGFTLGQNYRVKIILSIGLIITVTTTLIFFTQLQSIWVKIDNFTDGIRASIMIGYSALMGLGLGLGLRLSHKSLNLGFLAVIIISPFVFVSLKANATTSVIALVWLFLIADGLGSIFLNRINRLVKNPTTYHEPVGLLSIAVGLELLILITLLLGLIGATSATGILLTLMVLTVLCFPQVISNTKRLSSIPWKKSIDLTEFELAGLFMLTALFLIFWIGALAPEVGADALGFRIAAPAIWLREGIIKPLPEMLNSYGQFAAEMLHLIMLPFTGYNAAKILQFGLAIILIFSSIFQIFKPSQRKAAPLLLFAFWGCTLIWWQMIWGFVDLTQMFFYFACILSVRSWLDDIDNPFWLIVAGITGATATTVKINGAGALGIAGLFVLCISLFRSRSLVKSFKNILFLIIPAILCLLPWLVRSYWLTRNPFFPFALDIFKSPLLETMPVKRFGVGLSFPAVLTIPWGLFFDPSKYVELGTYHPLILVLAILGLVGLFWTSSRKDWFWLVAGVISYLLWLVTEQNSRYSLFAIYFIALALSIGFFELQNKLPNRISQFIIQPLLVIGMIGGFGMQALRPTFWIQGAVSGAAFPTNVVLGDQSNESYLTGNVPTYYCANWLNRQDEKNAKIFQMQIRDHLYFEGKTGALLSGILAVTEPLTKVYNGSSNASDYPMLYDTLISEGYTYLVYHTAFMPDLSHIPQSERTGVLSTNFEETYLQLECADRGLRLYRIRSVSELSDTSIQTGPNLIKNSGFEGQGKNGLPLNWNLTGDGSVSLVVGDPMLRFNGETTITQEVPVNGDETYRLDVDFQSVKAENSAIVLIILYDSSGKMSLALREENTPIENLTTYSFYQTVPSEVKTAVIYISGSGVNVDNVTFQEMP